MCPDHRRRLRLIHAARRWWRVQLWLLLAAACLVCALQAADAARLLPFDWTAVQTVVAAIGLVGIGVFIEVCSRFTAWAVGYLHDETEYCLACQRHATESETTDAPPHT